MWKILTVVEYLICLTLKLPDFDTERVVEVIVMVITSSIPEQVITDLLVCTKQQNATVVMLPRFGLKKHLFKNFLKQPATTRVHINHQGCFLFFNYKYPEVDDDNHCCLDQRFIIVWKSFSLSIFMNSV